MIREMWGVRPSGYKLTTIENAVIGVIPYDVANFTITQVYHPDYWPDVSCFLAGDLRTLKYRISETTSLTKHPWNFLIKHHKNDVFVGFIAGGVCVTAIYMLNKHFVNKHGK